jgi:hypothetical protein
MGPDATARRPHGAPCGSFSVRRPPSPQSRQPWPRRPACRVHVSSMSSGFQAQQSHAAGAQGVRHQAEARRRVGQGLQLAALAGSLQRPERARRAPLGPRWPPRRRAGRPARRRLPAAPLRGGCPQLRAPLPRAGHTLTHAGQTRPPPGAAPGRTPMQSRRSAGALPPGGRPACLPTPEYALQRCRCGMLHAPARARSLR